VVDFQVCHDVVDLRLGIQPIKFRPRRHHFDRSAVAILFAILDQLLNRRDIARRIGNIRFAIFCVQREVELALLGRLNPIKNSTQRNMVQPRKFGIFEIWERKPENP